jgi:hypothetical protein
MRWRVALVVVVGLGAGPGCEGPTPATVVDPPPPWPPAAECTAADDCVAAGSKCCDCPTFAVPAHDPIHEACIGVRCPSSVCSDSTRVACDRGRCVLACVTMACPDVCEDGFATDDSGCLTCGCAAPIHDGCRQAADCVRVRADCCGCSHGGRDTAVLARDARGYDAGLMCDARPQCPELAAICSLDAELACVQGRCELSTAGRLPANACGRLDLLPCPIGQVCVINGNNLPTNEQGLGLCQPPPS